MDVAALEPTLSVVVPFRNARALAAGNMERLAAFLRGRAAPFEIIAVDDGSEDGTSAELLAAARRIPQLRVLGGARHAGKGACVGRGMLAARGEHVVFIDCDLPYPLEGLARVAAELRACDVAIACRTRRRGAPRSALRARLSPLFSALARGLLLPGIRDSQAGLKGFRRSAARTICRRRRCAGFAFDVEALLLARLSRQRIVQVELASEESGPSTVRPLRDGARMLGELAAIWWRLRRNVYDLESAAEPS